MPVDIPQLERRRAAFEAASQHAAHTLTSYTEGWRYFVQWCADAERVALPCSPETLALYVVSLIESGRKITTAKTRVCAVTSRHKAAGYPNPYSDAVTRVLIGAQRILQQTPRQKIAITVGDLRKIFKTSTARPVCASRNRAIVALGFACGMRRSELCGLDLADVTFEPEGVRLTIRKSKTDQNAQGRLLGIHPAKHAGVCPVRVLRAWLALRGDFPGPLFCATQNGYVTANRLCGESVNHVVKKCVAAIGKDAAAHGGHSLRSGFITTCVEAGATELSIMQRTGHTSVHMVNRYVRPASVFRVNPLKGAL